MNAATQTNSKVTKENITWA